MHCRSLTPFCSKKHNFCVKNWLSRHHHNLNSFFKIFTNSNQQYELISRTYWNNPTIRVINKCLWSRTSNTLIQKRFKIILLYSEWKVNVCKKFLLLANEHWESNFNELNVVRSFFDNILFKKISNFCKIVNIFDL